jgi:hypothetical protein
MTPQLDGHPVALLAQTSPAGQTASVVQTMVVAAAVTHAGVQDRPHNGRHRPVPQLPHVEPTTVHGGKLVVVVLVVLIVVTVLVDVVDMQLTAVAQLPQVVQHFS